MAILNMVKVLLGISEIDYDKIDILSLLIEICQEEATSYCNLAAYVPELDSIVVQMVIERYNRIGVEGVSSTSSSGISESYLDGYSAQVYSSLNKKRRVRIV